MENTSKLALLSVWSMVFAICCMLLFAAITLLGLHMLGGPLVIAAVFLFIIAFVSGVFALFVITLCCRSFKNYFLACCGLVLSAVPMYFIVASFLGTRARIELGKAHVGTYNLQLLGKELKRYTETNDGRLPLADEWCDALMKKNLKLSEADFRHPQSRKAGLKGECHFAFNKNISGMRLADIPGDVVLLFEADGNWNLNGTAELLNTRYRENGYITILFVDGGTADYWFYEKAVRKFKSELGNVSMYYESPRWKP